MYQNPNVILTIHLKEIGVHIRNLLLWSFKLHIKFCKVKDAVMYLIVKITFGFWVMIVYLYQNPNVILTIHLELKKENTLLLIQDIC